MKDRDVSDPSPHKNTRLYMHPKDQTGIKYEPTIPAAFGTAIGHDTKNQLHGVNCDEEIFLEQSSDFSCELVEIGTPSGLSPTAEMSEKQESQTIVHSDDFRGVILSLMLLGCHKSTNPTGIYLSVFPTKSIRNNLSDLEGFSTSPHAKSLSLLASRQGSIPGIFGTGKILLVCFSTGKIIIDSKSAGWEGICDRSMEGTCW